LCGDEDDEMQRDYFAAMNTDHIVLMVSGNNGFREYR